MTPKRIQRKRTKGWTMPPNTVYVGRPSKWGNPYRTGDYVYEGGPTFGGRPLSAQEAVAQFRAHTAPLLPVEELRGKDLACWCKEGEPCHADILLELANRERTTQ